MVYYCLTNIIVIVKTCDTWVQQAAVCLGQVFCPDTWRHPGSRICMIMSQRQGHNYIQSTWHTHIHYLCINIYIYTCTLYILLCRFIVITMFIQYIITNSVCIYIYAHAYSMCPLMFLDTHGVPATAFSTCDKQGCACKLRPQARQLIERTCFPQKIWLFLYLCAYKYLDVSTTMLYEVNVYLRISKVCVLFCFPKFGSSLFILMWLFCANERYGIFICICCMHVFA